MICNLRETKNCKIRLIHQNNRRNSLKDSSQGRYSVKSFRNPGYESME
jgi:hypothetical protein